MNGSSEGAVERREDPFLERLRRAMAHDLRTPLGTIANYAAVLEYHGQAKPADVRVFAGRIRQSAVRAAVMLQHLTDAIQLSHGEPAIPGVDPNGLVRSLLSEIAVPVRYPAHGTQPDERVPFDPALMAFTWRAFLAVNTEVAGDTPLDLDLEILKSDDTIALDMWIGPRPDQALDLIGSSQYFEAVVDPGPQESCFALGLAEDLIRMRGGRMGLSGKPGQASSLRVSFPRER
jgi:signal transduction histidine kinase